MATEKTTGTIRVKSAHLRRVVKMSEALIESTETLLEDLGAYKPAFLKSLKQSLADERSGNVRQIKSLTEL